MPSTRLFVAGGHRLERGERAAGRHPHLGVRVPGAGAHRDRRVVGDQRERRARGRAGRGRRTCAGRSARPRAASACLAAGRDAAAVEREVGARRAAAGASCRRGVPGRRRYGCHPKATGTARGPVGTTVVSMRELALAGGDGHLDAVRERERRGVDVDRGAEARPAARGSSVDRHAIPAGRRAGRGSGGRCRRCRAAARRGRRRRRRPGSGGPPGGWPTARAAAGRAWPPPAAPARPPGSARCSRPRQRSETPVIPRSGRNVADRSPAATRIAGCPGSGPRPPMRRRSVTPVAGCGVGGGERFGDGLEGLAFGVDPDQPLDDAADDHDPGADEVADEQAGAAGAVADQGAVERRAEGAGDACRWRRTRRSLPSGSRSATSR